MDLVLNYVLPFVIPTSSVSTENFRGPNSLTVTATNDQTMHYRYQSTRSVADVFSL